jgi:hypothetical protein
VILTVDPGTAGERHEARISALLWSGDADPRLLAAEHFRSVQQFKAWLLPSTLNGSEQSSTSNGHRACLLASRLSKRLRPSCCSQRPMIHRLALMALA